MAMVEADVVTPTVVPPVLPERATILEREAVSLLERVKGVVVTTDDDYAAVVDYAKKGRLLIRALKEIHDPNVDEWYKGHRRAVERRKAALATPEAIVATADQKALAYHEQKVAERKAAEEFARREQERLERAARDAAEFETEQLRKEAEDQALAAAAEAEARGDTATAERILETPVVIEPVMPALTFTPQAPIPQTPQAEGYGFRTSWKAELLSLDAVIQAAANGNTMARSLLAWNQSAADGAARSTKGAVQVPGVTFRKVRAAAGRF